MKLAGPSYRGLAAAITVNATTAAPLAIAGGIAAAAALLPLAAAHCC